MTTQGPDEASPPAPGVVLLAGLGVFLGAMFLGDLLTKSGGPLLQQVVEATFGLTLPAALVLGARWLSGRSLDQPDVWRAAMWALGGFSALTFLSTLEFYVESLGSGLPPGAFETLVLNAQIGAVGGLLVGVYDARARRNAGRATTARDRYRLLNQLLRHNALNSVQVVEGYLEAYEAGDVDEATMLSTVRSQFGAIEGLVEQARTIERANEDDELQVVDLAERVSDQVTVLQSSHAEATVETDLAETAAVRADPLVDAVVENLLSNAIEHHDRPDPTVTVRLRADQETVLLEVADDGPGIGDEHRGSLFEVEDTSSTHGIGLYLVDTLVDRYGGSVRWEENEPRGTRFVVTLPRADGEAVFA